jgi:hypothetical protein
MPYEAVQLRRPYPGGVAAAVQSDANGSFSFTSVTPEELFLTIRIPGYRAISQPLRLGGQRNIDLGTIPLMVTDPDVINYPWEPLVPSRSTFGRTKYIAVSGRVVDREGTPIADVRVAMPGWSVDVATDGRGIFAFPKVPLSKGRYWLRLRAQGFQTLNFGPFEVKSASKKIDTSDIVMDAFVPR